MSAALTLFITTIPAFNAMALNYNQGTYNTCTYNTCGITISSSNNISVDVTPTSSGACSINNDSVSVLTDSSTGYSLTLSTNSTSTSLSNGSSNITTGSGSFSSPATLGVNQWGYRVDGAGGFGSGTSAVSNSSYPLSTLFAGAPANNQTPTTIVTSSSAADPAVTTTVWYGVCADSTLSSGLYSGQILYTATTN
jgi:hypothetical protein